MAEWKGRHSKPLGHMFAEELRRKEGKPHIRPWEPQRRDFYVCRGCGYVGLGITPYEAWRVWDFGYRNGGGCR